MAHIKHSPLSGKQKILNKLCTAYRRSHQNPAFRIRAVEQARFVRLRTIIVEAGLRRDEKSERQNPGAQNLSEMFSE